MWTATVQGNDNWFTVYCKKVVKPKRYQVLLVLFILDWVFAYDILEEKSLRKSGFVTIAYSKQKVFLKLNFINKYLLGKAFSCSNSNVAPIHFHCKCMLAKATVRLAAILYYQRVDRPFSLKVRKRHGLSFSKRDGRDEWHWVEAEKNSKHWFLIFEE